MKCQFIYLKLPWDTRLDPGTLDPHISKEIPVNKGIQLATVQVRLIHEHKYSGSHLKIVQSAIHMDSLQKRYQKSLCASAIVLKPFPFVNSSLHALRSVGSNIITPLFILSHPYVLIPFSVTAMDTTAAFV